MYDPILLLISLLFAGIGMLVSYRLKSKFNTYSNENLSAALTGRQVAERMLRENGIYDVKITSVDGTLTDHYNPVNKTVNLSRDVYSGASIASAAVAAHECGHAVQHNRGYSWVILRSALVPIVNISSNLMAVLTFIIALIAYSMPALTNTMLLVFIVLQSIITIFTLVTLPVEIDASKRALHWLNNTGITSNYEYSHAKDALQWAAYTYIVQALGSIATLVYYIWRFTSNNRNNN